MGVLIQLHKVDQALDPVPALEVSVQAQAQVPVQALVPMQHLHQMSQRHLVEFLAQMDNNVVVSQLTRSVMTHLMDHSSSSRKRLPFPWYLPADVTPISSLPSIRKDKALETGSSSIPVKFVLVVRLERMLAQVMVGHH